MILNEHGRNSGKTVINRKIQKSPICRLPDRNFDVEKQVLIKLSHSMCTLLGVFVSFLTILEFFDIQLIFLVQGFLRLKIKITLHVHTAVFCSKNYRITFTFMKSPVIWRLLIISYLHRTCNHIVLKLFTHELFIFSKLKWKVRR